MLEVTHLSFSFGKRFIFKDISFSLKKESILHIHGPNGSGKTTLISVLIGLFPPTAGNISFDPSHNPSKNNPKFLFEYLGSENNALFENLNAIDNLLFWSRFKSDKTDEKKILCELKEWGFKNTYILYDYSINRFSTGMKRKLALARVSLSESPLWILDEPLYGLDENSIELFRSRLKIHISNGGSVIIVSHDLSCFKGLDYDSLGLINMES